MENVETQSSSQSGLNQLQAQYESLRSLVVSILVLVILISGSLNIYLWRQVKFIRADLNAVRPQAAQTFVEYEKVKGQMDDFVKRITDYGKAHPDFVPILVKFGLDKTAPATAPAKK